MKPAIVVPQGLECERGFLSPKQQAECEKTHPAWVEYAPLEESRTVLQLGSFLFRYDKKMGIQAVESRPLLPCYAPSWVDNVIVNHYDTKESHIKPHIDSLWFGERVEIISLGSSCTMTFAKEDTSNENNEKNNNGFATKHTKRIEYRLTVNPGDKVILSGEARYVWTHEIRAQDIQGPRSSVTCRSVRKEAYWQQAAQDLCAAMPGVFGNAGEAMDMAKYIKPKIS